MKRGQHQATLHVVCVSLTGQQAFTQDALCFLQRAALCEIRILCDQHIPDVIRMIREEHLLVQDLESDEIPMSAGKVLQES
jgi:NADPH-dependent glutamate synthase beta subunit-like oxidoreductase